MYLAAPCLAPVLDEAEWAKWRPLHEAATPEVVADELGAAGAVGGAMHLL